ncbi:MULTISPECIES: hypothetical protein [Kitasatospora]|uniref:Uncharacterized protein n=1 Tax=Kitasatospora setae (strain ATCC 33774 / DSM 43861 / JCM 3304 / KCC A-0304 / NBRC 14216 / KM-6054) TaxID=452652 RepID=E4N8J6_KITSK|nr:MULTISPECIES: hypothetical protein [Kitasatospora]BAJ27527.1 hypothetical protein KSE_17030 [Kitasatospora setae KM-6054]
MTDRGPTLPALRHQLVTAVLTLAAPGLQDDAFDPAALFSTLFTEACDADAPLPWLGHTLRTGEEAALTADLGTALHTLAGTLPPDATPADHLTSPAWPAVTTTAARLARVLVANDHHARAR